MRIHSPKNFQPCPRIGYPGRHWCWRFEVHGRYFPAINNGQMTPFRSGVVGKSPQKMTPFRSTAARRWLLYRGIKSPDHEALSRVDSGLRNPSFCADLQNEKKRTTSSDVPEQVETDRDKYLHLSWIVDNAGLVKQLHLSRYRPIRTVTRLSRSTGYIAS